MVVEILEVLEFCLRVAQVIELVSKIIEGIARIQNFLQAHESIEGFGARFLEADSHGIDRNNFDSYLSYLNFVRQMSLDEQNLEKYDKKDCQIRFIKEYHRFLNENDEDLSHLNFTLHEAQIMEQNPEASILESDPNWLKVFYDVFKQKNINLEKISEYLEGKLDFKEAKAVHNAILEAERKLHPNKSKDEIQRHIDQMKGIRRQ